MTTGIEVTGLDEVVKRLGKDLRPVLKKVAFAIGKQVEGKINITAYPTQPAPVNPDRWYQRGYGSKWRRKDGSVGGRATSEQLGQRWATRAKGWGAVVGNPASYAPFVQSQEKQAAIHKATGWVTDVQVAEEVAKSGVVERMVRDAVVKELGG
jgi:hypothetical protein